MSKEDRKRMIDSLIEIRLKTDEDFLKVKETLTRIGIPSRTKKKLTQTCHILHKAGKYYLVHFKELFGLDGRVYNLSDEDICRRNTIAVLLEEWGLVEIVDRELADSLAPSLKSIKIISFSEKNEWELVSKYTIGSKHYHQNSSS